MKMMWRPEHNALLASRMVGRSQDAHNECSAPALMEETPKALRVAVVEDDPRIQQLISAEITDEGHDCICFGSAEDFLDEAGSDRFDLLLLDLMLPGMDALACLKQLQHQAASQPALRVVIVTALNYADKKHEALANGAEARACWRLRRQLNLKVANLSMNTRTRDVMRGDRAIRLSVKEYDLLNFLMRGAGRVLERQEIMHGVWGENFYGDDNLLDVYVRYVRQKVELEDAPTLINTVRGVGFILREQTN